MMSMHDAIAASSILSKMLASCSIEVSSRNPGVATKLPAWFAAETEVFINYVPATDFRNVVETAVALRRANFEPVPHITARGLSTGAELDSLIAALASQAGVTQILAIGGDVSVSRGPYKSTLDLIQSGVLQRSGIKRLGLAGYPEGHHTVPEPVLWHSLLEKLEAARAAELVPHVVTQFCFEPQPIIGWLADLERREIDVQVRIGVAGPASFASLMTFAMRCGIGNSLRAVTNRPESIGRMLRDGSPDELVHGLSRGWAAHPPRSVPRLHIFPFGGVAKSGEWLTEMQQAWITSAVPHGG